MSANGRTERIAEASPRLLARFAGLFYLLYILIGVFGEYFISDKLIVDGDAVESAHRLLAHESLFRWGFATDILMVACYLAVTLLFYEIFNPVNRRLSLLAAWFGLAGCNLEALSSLYHLAPLAVLKGGQYLSVFKVEQLQALAFLSLDLCAQVFNTALIFFGFYFILIGYLIFRSTFLPRILGVLMAISGLVWLTFLSPPLADYLSAYLPIGVLGEGALALWMLLKGVNVQRWKEQAAATAGVLEFSGNVEEMK